MTRLLIEPLAVSVEVLPGQTLLRATLAADIVLPSSCRNGTCRACMARLLAGDVQYLVEWPGVLREERAEGWTLPCVAVPTTDVVLLAPDSVRRAKPAGTPPG